MSEKLTSTQKNSILIDMNHRQNYIRLLIMFVFHFIAMYIFMYAMVNTFGNIYSNYNQFYMAALMAAPMVIIELFIMSSMYPKKKLNLGIITIGIVVLVCSFFFIREQIAIDDNQFLRSMIPHHAGAILMCEKARLNDPQIQELCKNIISGQQSEINWMKEKLNKITQ